MSPARTVAFGFLDFGQGGAQRLALTTWRHLDRARFKPVLVCVGRRGALVDEAVAGGVPAQVLRRLQQPFDVAAIPRLAKAMIGLHPQVVHVPLYSRASPYLRTAAKLARVPLVVAHEHVRAEPPGLARLVVDRLLAPHSRFVAVSRAQQDELLDQGVPIGHIKVVYNGVEIGEAPPSRQHARAELSSELGLELGPSRPLVVVPARLHAMKGHVDLLAAAAIVKRDLPDLLVLCAGSGPLADRLPALAAAAGLSDTVRFVGQRHDIDRFIAAADVVALTSHREGLPLSLLEAMAAARPVIATAVGGVPEAVADGEVGRVVPARQPAALAAALHQLLDQPLLAARLGAAGRRHAAARFSAATSTRNLELAYEDWLGEHRAGSRPEPFGGRGPRPAIARAATAFQAGGLGG